MFRHYETDPKHFWGSSLHSSRLTLPPPLYSFTKYVSTCRVSQTLDVTKGSHLFLDFHYLLLPPEGKRENCVPQPRRPKVNHHERKKINEYKFWNFQNPRKEKDHGIRVFYSSFCRVNRSRLNMDTKFRIESTVQRSFGKSWRWCRFSLVRKFLDDYNRHKHSLLGGKITFRIPFVLIKISHNMIP